MKKEQIVSKKFELEYYIKMRRELVLWKRDLRISSRMQYRDIPREENMNES